jgi:high-affinity iron transporter
MLASLIIVFREVLEAGLIVGIVLAATRAVPLRGLWVGLGIAGGVIGACLVAAFAGALADLFDGSGQELFNAAVLGVAVLMLTWHNVWMASHGREIAAEMRAVGQAVQAGRRTLAALAVVVGVAVLREGSEVVLFLYGVIAAGGTTAAGVAAGVGLGIVAGGLVSALLYFGLLAIPVRHFFRATTWLITLLAAGLASQAVAFLQQGGYADAWSTPLWNSSAVLPEDGILGRVLHTLVGYTDQPTGMQLAAYLAVVMVILGLMRVASGGQPERVAAG